MNVLKSKSPLKMRVQMTKGGFYICIQVCKQIWAFVRRAVILQIFLKKKKPTQTPGGE